MKIACERDIVVAAVVVAVVVSIHTHTHTHSQFTRWRSWSKAEKWLAYYY